MSGAGSFDASDSHLLSGFSVCWAAHGNLSGITTESSTLDVPVLPGVPYDVYIVPQVGLGCNSTVPPGTTPWPPQFFAKNTFGENLSGLPFPIPEPPAQLGQPPGPGQPPQQVILSGEITGFADQATQWLVDVVEPKRGLPISVALTAPAWVDASSGTLSYRLQVSWQYNGILRLTPVQTQPIRPTVYWLLEATGPSAQLALGASEVQASFYVNDLVTEAYSVSGAVTSDLATPVSAQLFVQSTLLTGRVADNAAVSLHNVATNPDGTFTLELPPGNYDLQAMPAVGQGDTATDGGAVPYGVSQVVSFSVVARSSGTQSPDSLNAIVLGAAPVFTGDVENPNGDKLSNVQLNIVPYTTPAPSYWNAVLPLGMVATGLGTSTISADNGRYSLSVDAEVAMSLFVQPPSSSGYPWQVCLNGEELPSGGSQSYPLPIPLTFPALVSGKVTDPSGSPVAYAALNAWFPYQPPGSATGVATVAVQVGATITASDGTYQLVLPPVLPPWPPTPGCPLF